MKIIQQKEYHKCKLLWKLSIEQHQPSLYCLSPVSGNPVQTAPPSKPYANVLTIESVATEVVSIAV
jgi:hypothetical protein